MPHRTRAIATPSRSAIGILSVLFIAAASASDDPASLRREVATDPGAAAAVVARALQPAAQVTPRRAAEVTNAVIVGLGPTPAIAQISGVVFSAVRAVPDRVLDIVRAAALASPPEAADEIAASAVSALPDPWKMVTYRRYRDVRRGERDFKGGPDFKGEPDYKGEGIPMPLAEAVAQTVIDSGANATAVYAAVEAVLRTSPGWLITSVYDPRGISGVGEAGLNNYANEPFRPRTLPPKPKSKSQPRPVPTPAPVSP